MGLELVAKEDGGVADALLDDPAALGHIGDQLEHAVALLVGALQKPVEWWNRLNM